MITVKISSQEREIEREHDIDDTWVHRQCARSPNSTSTCIRVIVEDERNRSPLMLSTKAHPSEEGRSRPPRPSEQRLFDLWDQLGLDKPTVLPDQIVGFLKRAIQRPRG